MSDILLPLAALAPVAVLILTLGVFRFPSHGATALALGLAAFLAAVLWKMPLDHLAGALAEGTAFALWPIMVIIFAAIYTYYLAEKTGALDTIKKMLSGLTSDRRVQVLILAWGFGGFLEAVAGYGTAVAIPASILAALGFNPLFAAVISLVANTVPTAFGAVGIPVSTLAALTGLNPQALSQTLALQLTPFILLVPFVLVILTGGGLKAVKGVWGITLAAGLSFAVPHYLVAAYLGPELPAVLGAVVSLATVVVYARFFLKEKRPSTGITARQALVAWLPYILILGVVLAVSKVVPAVNAWAGHIKSTFNFFAGGNPVDFKWVATPGVLIILAASVGALVQGARPVTLVRTLGSTVWKLNKSTLTVVFILAMAKIMDYSGMIGEVARLLVNLAGGLFPLFSPLVGALGTFVTGSDTSSNILFGKLQLEVAAKTGIDPLWLAAANTAGATAGKMISPQSIAVATGATGLSGQEGQILGKTLWFCLGYVLLLGLLVWLL